MLVWLQPAGGPTCRADNMGSSWPYTILSLITHFNILITYCLLLRSCLCYQLALLCIIYVHATASYILHIPHTSHHNSLSKLDIMELGGITDFLKNKSILVTGSTGFLGKIFLEKVLRVQPDVKKLFLLVRETEATTAAQRLQREVVDKDLFCLLREKYGDEFHSFIWSKLSPVAGDVTGENLRIADGNLREKLWEEIDIIVNVAGTTNFDERYDVALDVNVLGVKHVVEFAKRCQHLQMLLHVSTAYVAGVPDALILEKPFHFMETLRGGLSLDVETEIKIAEERRKELRVEESSKEVERRSMKELGLTRARYFGWPTTYVFTKAMGEMLLGHLRGDLPVVIMRPTMITSIYKEPLPGWVEGVRTIDSMVVGYAKRNFPCMYGDVELVMDVIPGDMVVNAMIVAMVAHSSQKAESVYHIGSSVRNPVTYSIFARSGYKYFLENPRTGKNGEKIKTTEVITIKSKIIFHLFILLLFRLPLEVLHVLNQALCGLFSRHYGELNRKYRFVMRLIDLYEPYAFFRGRFDDTNTGKLRVAMDKLNIEEAKNFDFDPKHIGWEDYFSKIHVPGIMKYVNK